MEKKKQFIIGFLILVLLTSSVYILLPDKVRIDFTNTQTKISVYENNSWVVGGIEKISVYNGTKKLTPISYDTKIFNQSNEFYFIRYTYFNNSVILSEVYNFDGSLNDVEFYPISHFIKIENGKGLILQYEVSNLKDDEKTRMNNQTNLNFGHNIKIELNEGFYYSKITKLTTSSKLITKYKINSTDYSINSRVYDPLDEETPTQNIRLFTEPTPMNKQEIEFYNKKISNSEGIILSSKQEFIPIWDKYKTIAIIQFQVNSIGDKKELTNIKEIIKQFEKYNPIIEYSNNYIEDIEIINEDENNKDIIISKIYSEYKPFDNKIMNLEKSTMIKLIFEYPRYQKESFNISIIDDNGKYDLDPDLGECGVIVSAGTYTLNQSINSTGTCINITSPNVTLDCQGFTINYSTGGTANTFGITSNQFNSTIQNCDIVDGNTTSALNTRYGIYFNGADNGTIYNNSVNSNSSSAIYLYNGASYSNVTLNNFSSNSYYAGYLNTNADNNSLFNNIFLSNASTGLYLISVQGNNLISNNVTTKGSLTNGIYFNGANYNALTNNNGTAVTGMGIILLSSDYNNLTGNIARTGASGANYGAISISAGDNNRLINNSGTSTSSTSGIIIYNGATNNYLEGNNGTGSSNGKGIYLYLTNNNILINNIGAGSGSSSMGIQVTDSYNNSLTNNLGTATIGAGISVGEGNNTLTNNNGTSTSYIGIYITGSNNNLIGNIGRTGSSTASHGGIRIHAGDNNNLTNNTGISTSSTSGIILSSGSNNNILINNNGTGATGYGLFLNGVSNNIIINQIATTTGTGSNATQINASNNTLFQDCSEISGIKYDISFFNFNGSVNNTFLNCSYNLSKEYLPPTYDGELMRKWYYQANATYSNGTAVNQANVSAYNVSGILRFTDLTNSSGYIPIQQLREYINVGGTRTYASNYSIMANVTGFSAIHDFNVTGNYLNDVFVFIVIPTTSGNESSHIILNGESHMQINENGKIILS